MTYKGLTFNPQHTILKLAIFLYNFILALNPEGTQTLFPKKSFSSNAIKTVYRKNTVYKIYKRI